MSDQQNNSIILCPGQGAQHVGMGKAWFEQSSVAAQTFAAADETLGLEISKLCFEGPEDQVNRTDIAQAAIYVTSIAAYQALAEDGKVGNIPATAGLSLGEYTALHLAGAFSFADGLKLVQLRGQYMQEAAEASDSGMVALIGADEDQANELCDKARGDDVLVPANFNAPGQIVISGSSTACERSVSVAGDMGLRATALKVAGAFHSPLMQPAADRMADALESVTWSSPRIPVLSNVTGEPHSDDIEEIKKLLVQQITSPVRWVQNIQWLLANVTGEYIEVAPGKVLGGLMRRIDRGTKVTNYAVPS